MSIDRLQQKETPESIKEKQINVDLKSPISPAEILFGEKSDVPKGSWTDLSKEEVNTLKEGALKRWLNVLFDSTNSPEFNRKIKSLINQFQADFEKSQKKGPEISQAMLDDFRTKFDEIF